LLFLAFLIDGAELGTDELLGADEVEGEVDGAELGTDELLGADEVEGEGEVDGVIDEQSSPLHEAESENLRSCPPQYVASVQISCGNSYPSRLLSSAIHTKKTTIRSRKVMSKMD
jgi:hypothetical protein